MTGTKSFTPIHPPPPRPKSDYHIEIVIVYSEYLLSDDRVPT